MHTSFRCGHKKDGTCACSSTHPSDASTNCKELLLAHGHKHRVVFGDSASCPTMSTQCPKNHYFTAATGCNPCPAGQGAIYAGCTNTGVNGVPVVPVPYQGCRACGAKVTYPCSSGPPCQAKHVDLTTGTQGHRLHLRPEGMLG